MHRIDDIPQQVADDIHAFRRDLDASVQTQTKIDENIFFVAHSQKSTGFDLLIFYPLRKQWYIITRKRASHHRRCISSAAGCISFRNDDIQNFVLMICNSCGIDDIHGFAVIYARVRIHTQK